MSTRNYDLDKLVENAEETTKSVEKFIRENEIKSWDNKDITFNQAFNETWFSNILAWLLDPKGSHGLGVIFAQEFLKRIALERSGLNNSEDQRDEEKFNYYKHNGYLLKHGKKGSGRTINDLSIKNLSPIREFYLAKGLGRGNRGPKYCDVALLDLDSSDGLFVVIENKLFTSTHSCQLEEYLDVVQEKFSRAKIREYVFLTLDGKDPKNSKGVESVRENETDDKTEFKYWVRLSWYKDVYEILEDLIGNKEERKEKQLPAELNNLLSILEWLNKIEKSKDDKKFGNSNDKSSEGIIDEIEKLRFFLIYAAAECLLEELQRLGEGMRGEWVIKDSWAKKKVTLEHSSTPTRPLYVELLPNLSITVQSEKGEKPLFEKIIVPYGCNSDQIFNLLDLAARDIYDYHFENSTHLYRNDKNRLTKTRTKTKQRVESIFDFVYEYHQELKVLFTFSDLIWDADQNN